jgi:hypothetical protein
LGQRIPSLPGEPLRQAATLSIYDIPPRGDHVTVDAGAVAERRLARVTQALALERMLCDPETCRAGELHGFELPHMLRVFFPISAEADGASRSPYLKISKSLKLLPPCYPRMI